MNQTKYEKAIVDLVTDMETFLVINGLSLTQFNEWKKDKDHGSYEHCANQDMH